MPGFKRSSNLLLLEKHLAEHDPLTLFLVLDDAQNYSGPALEELRLLLGLGGGRRSAFALILLGNEYLLASLRLLVQRVLLSRISAAARLGPLAREEIPSYLNWHISRAGLDRDLFEQAAIDMLADASEGNPCTLGLLAQAAGLEAARRNSFTIEACDIHKALRQVPAATLKLPPLNSVWAVPEALPGFSCSPLFCPPLISI